MKPRLRRPQDSAWTVATALIGGLALLVALLALVAHYLDRSWQPVIVAAAFAHQLMWAAPLALVLLAVSRRWYATASAVIVLIAVVLVEAPLYRGSDVPAGGTRLTVLQANLKIGAADAADVVQAVAEHHADVLMTEELTTGERARLITAGLSKRLPYRFDAALPEGGGGLAIWSRFPLSDEHNYPGFELGVLSATARISPTRTATVVAVHLLPPYPYPSTEWVREIGRLRPMLAADATQGRRPTIVAGDFNATTDNAQFRSLLADGLQDAAEHSGAGYLTSYPTDRFFPPVIAIDHVLTHDAPAVDAATFALPGSDHRGLAVHVRLDG
jgi:endonuclease/exonuclease/phosphatase (EEP) superfamily protein YafD